MEGRMDKGGLPSVTEAAMVVLVGAPPPKGGGRRSRRAAVSTGQEAKVFEQNKIREHLFCQEAMSAVTNALGKTAERFTRGRIFEESCQMYESPEWWNLVKPPTRF